MPRFTGGRWQAAWLTLAIGMILVGGLAGSVQAANPSLAGISPIGGQRGTELEVTFNGARLEDAQEILLYYPGIKVAHFEVVNDRQIKTKLAIAPDCQLGIHAMRVRTASGISDLKTFSVGALPEISEKEPNSEFAAPQPIELNTTVSGVVQAEDVDYFLVTAKKGQRISAEIEGIRLGVTFFDPYVAIMDMGRFELASSDDSALVYQDAVASIVAPEDGTYVIQVRESAYGGSGSCFYRVHVGSFPRPRAVLPAGGRPGESLEVQWLGDVLGSKTEKITVPTEPDRLFGLLAREGELPAPSTNVFRVNDLTNTIEAEPNNARDAATACQVPGALNGVIAEPGDVDCFRFTAKKGQSYDVRVYARQLRSPLDSVLTIQRIGGAGVASNDDSGQVDSYARFNAPADDDYVVMIQDHLGQGGVNYSYRVEVTPVQPSLSLSLPERQQYVDVTVSVPRGNRTAIMVNASRQNFGGELNIETRDMVRGLSMQTVTMAANQTQVPVLFTAAADAELAGSLVDVVGCPVDEKIKFEGHVVQDTLLVRGQNNRRVWGHTADRMALALTEAAPFEVEIVQPQVPLVRNGSMGLRVRAKRKESFKEPISVYMLYNPPGVGSARTIKIAADKDEAEIPLNANSGAELKSWPIIVMGEATVGNGPVLVSSQMAELKVAEAYFNFAFNAAAVEQAQETSVVVNITQNTAFEGTAKVQLLGLPNEVTAEPLEFTKDDKELIFKVKTTGASPAGRHKTLLCRAIVEQGGEQVTHNLGGGELRIDQPLPPKPDAKPTPQQPKPAAVAAKPTEKPLTRLEQLRLEREQAKKASEGGQ